MLGDDYCSVCWYLNLTLPNKYAIVKIHGLNKMAYCSMAIKLLATIILTVFPFLPFNTLTGIGKKYWQKISTQICVYTVEVSRHYIL